MDSTTTEAQHKAFEALLTEFYHACTSTWPFDGVMSYKDAKAAVLAAYDAAHPPADSNRGEPVAWEWKLKIQDDSEWIPCSRKGYEYFSKGADTMARALYTEAPPSIEREAGFQEGIEAAIFEITRYSGHDTTKLLIQRVRALQPRTEASDGE